MKKIIAAVTLVTMLLGIFLFSVSAEAERNNYEQNEDYEASVAKVMKGYYANEQEAKEALAQLDTELIGEPQRTEHYPQSNSRKTSPSDYEFIVYSFKRGSSKVVYLQFMITANKTEKHPGPLDFCSIEWDNSYASYYASSGDSNMTTVKSKKTGIVVFNVEDDKLKKDEYAYGTVRVSPIKSGYLDYGAKYAHTYTTLAVSGSATVSYSSSVTLSSAEILTLGAVGNYGFTVNLGTNTKEWEIWDDNSVKLS